jgi:Ca2+-binding EF-hand superfamily protein
MDRINTPSYAIVIIITVAEYERTHKRDLMSAELQAGKEAFKLRQQAGAVRKFRSIDADGSGTLDLEEVLLGAPLLKLDEDQARSWFSAIDIDGSGEIDMEVGLCVCV